MAIIIDKSGPNGNAWAILGIVDTVLKDMGSSKEWRDMVRDRMMARDYDALCKLAEDVTDGNVRFLKEGEAPADKYV